MKKSVPFLLCFLILAVSTLLIALSGKLRTLFPSQETVLSHELQWGPLFKENLLVQEFTTTQKYLNRIDICFAKMPSASVNNNVFCLLDQQHRILYVKQFSSDEIDGAVYLSFPMKKSLNVGKNKKLLACISSVDGAQGNFSVYSRSKTSRQGRFYVTRLQQNDVVYSIENQADTKDIEGGLGIRIFESDSRFFTPAQFLFYLLALAFSLSVLFYKKIRDFILRIPLRPEKIFLPVSLVGGLLFAWITPPFQVPDEPSHFYRSYQVAEFNLFKYRDSIPASLVEVASVSDRMKFNVAEKISFKEIGKLGQMPLKPAALTHADCPNYIIPYLPQALGIAIGRILDWTPLHFFYLARIFNLLASVLLLYWAIRITPVFKWVFFILSLMPMTLYQMASLSYDASTICYTFLFVALVLKLAFGKGEQATRKEILWLLLLALLLGSSKPPYFIAVFSFLIIPVAKFVNWKKYALVFAGLIITAVVISQLWVPSRKFFESLTFIPVSNSVSQASLFSGAFFSEDQTPPPNDTSTTKKQETKAVTQTPAPASPFDAAAQKRFILENPGRYLEILIETVKNFTGLYIIAFVGLFGWVDTPLPGALVYAVMLLLILTALSDAVPGIRVPFWKKCYLLFLFLMGFLLVETAMYLYCNPVGFKQIQAVQGRYFIALSPFLFLLLYNQRIRKSFIKIFQPAAEKPVKTKGKGGKKQPELIPESKALYPKMLALIAILMIVYALGYSLYTILYRFYSIVI